MGILTGFFLCAAGALLVLAVLAAGLGLVPLALGVLLARLVPLLAVFPLLLWLVLHGRRAGGRWETLGRYRYAHRGLHAMPHAPENSLPAFRRAAQRGLGAELDVHLTADGRLAVLHDSSLLRTAGTDVRVEDLTVSELAPYRLEGTDAHIPLLDEVLPLFSSGTPLIVEIKTAGGNGAVLTEKTVACLDQFSVHYCIESFDPRVLWWLRRNRPEIVRGQLSQNFRLRPSGLGRCADFLLTNLLCNALTRPDFIAYRFEDRRNFCRNLCCGQFGVQAVYWTLRTPEELAQAEAAGALGIFEAFDPSEREEQP